MNTCIISCTILIVAWHLSLRVDVTSKAVYELVAELVREPQEGEHELVAELVREPQPGEQQEDAVEPASEEVANPADLQGKPRSITHKFSTLMFI